MGKKLICLQTAAGSVEEVVRPCTGGRSVASFLAGLKRASGTAGRSVASFLTGLWKVYGDAEKAEKIFSKCRKCREVYKEQWLSERSIDQLTVRTFARS